MFLFISGTELVFIFFIVLLVFGADKIPSIAKTLAKGVTQVRNATNEIKSEIQKSVDSNDPVGGVGKDIKKQVDKVKDDFNELTDSIKNHGVLSPILVRELGLNKFEVIAGERRLRASKQAGLETIPCLIDQKKDQDALESALIENLQREDLNAVEEARGYDRLKREFGLTQEDVAKSTGKARSTIANSLRLLSLPTSILDMLASGQIEKGHAKILASMDAKEALKTAQAILKKNLSVKDLNSSSNQKNSSKKIAKKQKDTDLLNIEQEMSESFGHKVEIDAKNKKSGRITISYNTSDELESIISKLSN